MRFTDTETKIAFVQGAEEARELGHSALGADHLVLGFLTNVRGRAFAALGRRGITYAEARDRVIAFHETGGTVTQSTPAADSSYDHERDALASIGLDLDQVRDAVQRTFGEDITEGWGDRASRPRRGRNRPEPDDDSADLDGLEVGGGRGRRGPRSERYGPSRLPMTSELRDIVGTLRREAMEARRAFRADQTIGDDASSDRQPDEQPDGPDGPDGHRGHGRPGRGRRRHGPRGHRHAEGRGGRQERRAERLLAALIAADSPAVEAALGDLGAEARAALVADLISSESANV